MKKLLVLGATGGTGQQILAQALESGHEVTAFVRTPANQPIQGERLRLAVGSVTDDTALAQAIKGQDVVISALGRGSSLKSDHFIERSVPAILAAMKTAGVRRLIFTSAIGVGAAYADAPPFSKVMIRVFLKNLYADKVIGEDLIRQSDLNWTIVQPAQLTNGPLTGRYQTGEHLKHLGMPKISRADLAHFIVKQIDDTTYVRKIVRVAY